MDIIKTGADIKRLRKDLNITQKELAKILGVTRSKVAWPEYKNPRRQLQKELRDSINTNDILLRMHNMRHPENMYVNFCEKKKEGIFAKIKKLILGL